MDAAAVFRQGFPGSMIPFHPSLAPAPIQYKPKQPLARKPVGHGDNSGDSGRIAHTLTACCRCRQVGIQDVFYLRMKIVTIHYLHAIGSDIKKLVFVRSAKLGVTRLFLDVCPASGLVPCASIMTRRKEKR